MKDLEISIVGAGIGGLAAALGLQRAGFRVRVHEQAPRLMQVGAGLSLSPSAAHGLRSLGLGPVLDEHAYAPEDQFIRAGDDGRVLMLTNRGRRLFDRYGERYYLIHRADLHEGLAAAVRVNDPEAIRLDRRLVHIAGTGDRTRLEFADGSAEQAQALIAADGSRSIVREQLFGPGAPQFTGYVAWRAQIPMERVPVRLEPRSGIFVGAKNHMNVYPMQKGRLLNVVAFAERTEWTEEGWSIRSTVDELYSHFDDWCDDVRAIVKSIPEGSLFKWGLFDREPLAIWSRDNATLLGDAAHPVLPFLGHGAVLAIEDGVVLARAFAASSSVTEALKRYETARRERATLVFNESRRAVRKFHAADPAKFTRSVNSQPVDEALGLFAYDPSQAPV